jgi:Fungal specific transcription factor domain/Fungal Zn(2)-Cys(6) binuclear cluster domain
MAFQHPYATSEPRNGSFSSVPGDVSNGDPRHPRIDNLSAQTGPTRAIRFETSSPVSTDFNFPLSGSPRTSISSGFDPTFGQTHHGQTSAPNYGQTTGGLPVLQSTVATPDFDRFKRNGSVAGSDQWSPPGVSYGGLPMPTDAIAEDNSNTASKGTDREDQENDDAEKAPLWSELRTKAGKERKRLPLACIACRRKKIRCSGEKPACKHCLRARIPCVYKVTARKAAPRTDYMAMLDKRLKRMEERVIKIIPKEDLPDLNTTGRSSVRPPIPGQTPKPTKAAVAKKRSADEAFVVELNGWTQQRGSILDATNKSQKQKEGENQLFVEGAESLPPLHLQEHLAEVFFDCIYGQSYLLLHKPSFMRKLKTGTVPPVLMLAVCAIASRFSTHPQVGGEPAFLRGDLWATPARAIVEKRHYEPNITILTVMLILGLHYFGTCEGGLSWSFGGQAMRMAYALQLHCELDHDPLGRKGDKDSQLSFTDREIRRRTMWACFLMDTFNSSGTQRPAFGNEDYMHIQLPIKESYFQMEVPGPTEDLEGDVPNPVSPGMGQVSNPKDNMGVAAYVIRAVVLWKRVVKYLNLGGKDKDPHQIWDSMSQFADLRRQLGRLRDGLPAHLIFNEANLQSHASERVANQFLYLHIIHAQNALFLTRFAIPTSPTARPPKDMPKQFLADAARDTVKAAEQISRLLEQANAHMLTVPFAGYCAYASSTVHVWGMLGSKNENLEISSKENLRHNYKYLNRMKRYWGMFHYMAESIKELYRHFADAAMKTQNQPPPQKDPFNTDDPSAATTPSAMFQYGDWFDKYPHGVSETEWEEDHRTFKKEAQGSSEAVMSQRSDLQSVEEFFASLSPPSKESHRKVPRKRGKSVAENKTKDKDKATAADANPDPQQAPLTHSLATPTLDFNAVTPTFPVQQTPNNTFAPSFDFSSNYSNPLSQLDRQMVFGAYAGIDPSVSAANTSFNAGQFNSGMWDAMNVDTGGMPDFGMGGMGNMLESSAWFMPFNMEPPVMNGEGWAGFDEQEWQSRESQGGSGTG